MFQLKYLQRNRVFLPMLHINLSFEKKNQLTASDKSTEHYKFPHVRGSHCTSGLSGYQLAYQFYR